jgi:hypothetical protein
MFRRFSAGLLLAASLAGGTIAHRHPILAEDSESSRPASQVVSHHVGLSPSQHVHAILQIVAGDSCWACHWHRIFTLSSGHALSLPIPPGQALALLPPRSAENAARFTRLSRGPPTLL